MKCKLFVTTEESLSENECNGIAQSVLQNLKNEF